MLNIIIYNDCLFNVILVETKVNPFEMFFVINNENSQFISFSIVILLVIFKSMILYLLYNLCNLYTLFINFISYIK